MNIWSPLFGEMLKCMHEPSNEVDEDVKAPLVLILDGKRALFDQKNNGVKFLSVNQVSSFRVSGNWTENCGTKTLKSLIFYLKETFTILPTGHEKSLASYMEPILAKLSDRNDFKVYITLLLFHFFWQLWTYKLRY